MRPYAQVSPLFWTGKTGKKLRQHGDIQRAAAYLMTSPHSHQSGVYWLPLLYLSSEVGLSIEGASKALAWLSNEGFAKYDEGTEWIWVCEMAAWQIGTELSPTDKRCKGLQQYLTTLPDLPFLPAFIARYRTAFHLKTPDGRGSGGASLEKNRSEQEKEQNRTDRASRIPDDFMLTPERRLVAEAETLPADRTFEKFRDYWHAVPGAKGRKLDWDATWRNWCKTERDRGPVNGKVQEPARQHREFGA